MDAVLLSELVGYKSYKQKGVCAAARSLLQVSNDAFSSECVLLLALAALLIAHFVYLFQFYRDVAPHLLHKRQRGRIAAMSSTAADERLAFGQTKASDGDSPQRSSTASSIQQPIVVLELFCLIKCCFQGSKDWI
jgi:hypothetical protein